MSRVFTFVIIKFREDVHENYILMNGNLKTVEQRAFLEQDNDEYKISLTEFSSTDDLEYKLLSKGIIIQGFSDLKNQIDKKISMDNLKFETELEYPEQEDEHNSSGYSNSSGDEGNDPNNSSDVTNNSLDGTNSSDSPVNSILLPESLDFFSLNDRSDESEYSNGTPVSGEIFEKKICRLNMSDIRSEFVLSMINNMTEKISFSLVDVINEMIDKILNDSETRDDFFNFLNDPVSMNSVLIYNNNLMSVKGHMRNKKDLKLFEETDSHFLKKFINSKRVLVTETLFCEIIDGEFQIIPEINQLIINPVKKFEDETLQRGRSNPVITSPNSNFNIQTARKHHFQKKNLFFPTTPSTPYPSSSPYPNYPSSSSSSSYPSSSPQLSEDLLSRKYSIPLTPVQVLFRNLTSGKSRPMSLINILRMPDFQKSGNSIIIPIQTFQQGQQMSHVNICVIRGRHIYYFEPHILSSYTTNITLKFYENFKTQLTQLLNNVQSESSESSEEEERIDRIPKMRRARSMSHIRNFEYEWHSTTDLAFSHKVQSDDNLCQTWTVYLMVLLLSNPSKNFDEIMDRFKETNDREFNINIIRIFSFYQYGNLLYKYKNLQNTSFQCEPLLLQKEECKKVGIEYIDLRILLYIPTNGELNYLDFLFQFETQLQNLLYIIYIKINQNSDKIMKLKIDVINDEDLNKDIDFGNYDVFIDVSILNVNSNLDTFKILAEEFVVNTNIDIQTKIIHIIFYHQTSKVEKDNLNMKVFNSLLSSSADKEFRNKFKSRKPDKKILESLTKSIFIPITNQDFGQKINGFKNLFLGQIALAFFGKDINPCEVRIYNDDQYFKKQNLSLTSISFENLLEKLNLKNDEQQQLQ